MGSSAAKSETDLRAAVVKEGKGKNVSGVNRFQDESLQSLARLHADPQPDQ